jgi:hypothetical protein
LVSFACKATLKIKKPFRFEEMWTYDPGCMETIKEVWDQEYNNFAMPNVVERITKCRTKLKSWSRHHFGSVRKEMEKLF